MLKFDRRKEKRRKEGFLSFRYPSEDTKIELRDNSVQNIFHALFIRNLSTHMALKVDQKWSKSFLSSFLFCMNEIFGLKWIKLSSDRSKIHENSPKYIYEWGLIIFLREWHRFLIKCVFYKKCTNALTSPHFSIRCRGSTSAATSWMSFVLVRRLFANPENIMVPDVCLVVLQATKQTYIQATKQTYIQATKQT